MRKEKFINGGVAYTRVTKQQAKKYFYDGLTIIFAPCNANMYYMNGCFMYPISNHPESVYDFDYYVNSFEYYNCDSEMGYYTKFFVADSDLRGCNND